MNRELSVLVPPGDCQAFAEMRFHYPFWRYQQMILAMVVRKSRDRMATTGPEALQNTFHVIAPPGLGKTIVGLELVRRFGRPATGLAPILVLCVLAGIGVAAVHVLPWAMIPDAIEHDEWRTGERDEGIYHSLTTLTTKVAASIAIPPALLVLEFIGYVPSAAQQPTAALMGICVVMGPIPAVLLCIGIVIALCYPLGRKAYDRIPRELETRRAGVE